MALTLSLAERQLLDHFRRCDDRGQSLLLDMARFQAVEPEGRADAQAPALHLVKGDTRPRRAVLDLIEALGKLNPAGRMVMAGYASGIQSRAPRHPIASSVELSGLDSAIAEVITHAEQTSAAGVADMLRKARAMAAKYPRQAPAAVLPFPSGAEPLP